MIRHPYHMVTVSPWPIMASIAAFTITTGGVLYMHRYVSGGFTLLYGLAFLLLILILWWRDVIREATFEGMHTSVIMRSLRIGVLLFILSEVMFFVSFFWAYFHSSLAPAIEIGGIWPPHGIAVFSPWGVPLLNTYILLYSGVTVTISHYALLSGDFDSTCYGLFLTVFYGIIFTFLQAFEYYNATFTIADGIYGSTFYLATGFHGLHVIIGTIFLMVCFGRVWLGHFTKQHHVGFESAIWYWHFVDVVWLFLFVSIYWWGSLGVF